jgi:hypothetical protein
LQLGGAFQRNCGNDAYGTDSNCEAMKGKGVPLHAMEASEGRGGIAPTHFQPRH